MSTRQRPPANMTPDAAPGTVPDTALNTVSSPASSTAFTFNMTLDTASGAVPDPAPRAAPDTGALHTPDLSDLVKRVKFSLRDGRIWLDEQRMLLLNANALGELRREMIDLLGPDAARGFFTRLGYRTGCQDARMARKVRNKTSLKRMFLAGSQLHCLEGIGGSACVQLEFDIERGTHYGEFVWTSPVEAQEHVRHFQIGAEPACWMQTGYASGFSTEFMGRPVLYREVECPSMGHVHCRIIGKPLEAWSREEARDMRFMIPGALSAHDGCDPDAPDPCALATLPPPSGARAHGLGEGSDGSNEPGGFGRSGRSGGSAGTRSIRPIGISPGFHGALDKVRRVAPTQATVLLLGESGTGKEVFARTVHRLSARCAQPFIALNCAAIPEQLIESELFGVERGAFTGAQQSRKGRFEAANGGTLFLDEIGTLSAIAQGKLLRALQEGEIERLGDTQARRIDVRVIAATNVDLRAEVRAGHFREDLFFRLNVFPVTIPPLRERHEDIPLLITHFLDQFNRRHGRRLAGFTQRAVDAMLSYDWPGNIRELENMIERSVIMAGENTVIDMPHLFSDGEQLSLPHTLSSTGQLRPASQADLTTTGATDEDDILHRIDALLRGTGASPGQVSLDTLETVLLRKAVTRSRGNVSAAARLLGITRAQMLYRLKSRGIDAAGIG